MSNKVLKTTISLMIVTVLSKIIGFYRELVITYVYGASYISDVYIISLSVPVILYSLVTAAISTSFIPLFYEIDKKEGSEKSNKFVHNIFNIVIIISFIMAILSFVFAEQLIKIFALNFSGEKLSLAVEFTRIMVFGMIFLGMSNIIASWLQIKGHFTIPGMVGIPYNIVLIVGIIISGITDKRIMAVSALVAMASQFVFQLIFALKKGYKYSPYINIKDEYIKKFMILIAPVFIGVAVNQVNSIVDRSLASTLGNGVITVLFSANRLNNFVLGIFIMTVSAVIYPMLSKLSNEKNKDQFYKSIYQSINSVILLILPLSVVSIVLSKPIVKVIFERGAFESDVSNMTAIALACYSIGMIGFALREILNKIFYSIQDTKTPMINGTSTMLMNIVLNLILIKFIGYVGLALSTSISSIVCTILLFNSLKKKIGYFGQDKIIYTILKALIASLCMGAITIVAYRLLSNILSTGLISGFIALLGSVGVGTIVYTCIIFLLKVDEINILINIIKNKFNKRIN